MITDEEIMNFCCNVKRLRVENKLTKKQMAEICGIGVGSLNKLEQGILPPRLSAYMLLGIYNYFGIMPSALFEKELHIN